MMWRSPLAVRRQAGLVLCFAGWFLAGSAAARADDVLPVAYPASRYEKFGAHSPFSPPTVAAVAPPPMVAAAGSWADNLSVTLLMQEGDKYIATVLDRESSQSFHVNSDKPNEQNLLLTSVQWDPKFNLTRVTLRKGTEYGQVSFDPNSTGGSSPSPGSIPGSAPPRLPSPGQIFHPPPAVNPGAGPATIVRRPMIPSAPAPVNGPRALPGRTAPAVKPATDDDDDDNDE